ncbi:MAG: hypothetical protein J0M04_00520 [Verrucomicrobia bacterium]|nr:hypothetical protein [Verrucomicrobiota bacterium]
MKTLFYASLVLPAIYIGCMVSFFVGVAIGFDIADVVRPHNELLMAVVGSLTGVFVLICIAVLWLGKHSIRLRVQWTIVLIMMNMIGVPLFLWYVVRGHLPGIRTPMGQQAEQDVPPNP